MRLAPKILILSNTNDIHADIIEKKLLETTQEKNLVCRINSNHLSQGIDSVSIKKNLQHFLYNNDKNCYSLNSIRAVYFRRPYEFCYSIKDSVQKTFAETETKVCINGIINSLTSRFWMNHPIDSLYLQKITQLRFAWSQKFPTPDTLITTKPEEAKSFIKKHNHVIYKKLGNAALKYPNNKFYVIQTTLLTEQHHELLSLIKGTPCLFQQLIPKRYDIRIIAVENNISAVAIDSQKLSETQTDYRNPYKLDQLEHKEIKIPKTVINFCITFMQKFNLKYSAFDFILNNKGRWFFLEVNPNGQYLWLEHKLPKLRISDWITAALLRNI